MAIIHDRWDMELVTRVTCSASASTTVTGDHIIDICETGGIEEAQLIVTCPAAAQALTLTVTGSDTQDGTYTKVLEFTTTANAEFEYRERIPLACPRYLKFAATTGTTAPAAAVAAVLRIAC